MKKLLIGAFSLLVFVACKQDDDSVRQSVPTCIKNLYEPGPQQDTTLLAVNRQLVGSEYHYWLATGNLAFDGPEYIVNEKCDTVCLFCFCPPRTKICQEAYEHGDWETIWEK